jgi:hypothetical protein
MAPGCKPGGLTPYAGSNPAPCTMGNFEFRIANFESKTIHADLGKSAIRNPQSEILERV